jgi:nucleotide-binding universal stress UspA family protein/uncharacterized protein (DUF2267 family)
LPSNQFIQFPVAEGLAMLPIRTILHPTDFSDCARHARELAVNLAKDYGAGLVLLNVIEPPNYATEVAIALPDVTVLRTAAEQKLSELKKGCKGVPCRHIVTMGYPAVEIVRVASEVRPDLIVLGTHGRTGLGRVVMGSVAEEVIRRSTCPVLATKPSDVQPVEAYEDWIASAMSIPEQRTGGGPKAASPEVQSRAANASYAATVEHTLRTTNRWLRDVRRHLPEAKAAHAFRVTRVVLRVLRDHLSVDHVASLGAQLPLFLRGILYEGWDPTGKPQKPRHKIRFADEVQAQFDCEGLDEPEQAIHAVLAALGEHLTPGEVAKLKRALPHEIRGLWEIHMEPPATAISR